MKKETIKTCLKVLASQVFFLTSSILIYKFVGKNMFYYFVGAFTFWCLGYVYGKVVEESVKSVLRDLRGK